MSEIDGEIAAFQAIVQSLEPLGSAACSRILRWAEQRFVSAPLDIDPEAISRWFEALGNAAREMGDVTPQQIIVAMAKSLDEGKAA